MERRAAVQPLTINPEALGRLGDRPLVETAPKSSPADLFPGASAFLNDRAQKRRRQQWEAAGPQATRLLAPGEQVLYVAAGQQMLTGLQALALGWMTSLYCHVLLVFTDTRLIEVLMNRTGKAPESRLRSFFWKDVTDLKLGSWLGHLSLKAVQGKKKHSWSVPLAGDRRLLKLLLPRLAERLHRQESGAAESVPLWHCPECGAAAKERPKRCHGCGILFRSRGLAALLSLAFPGAGLLYAGHPVLALFDFLGEVLGFAVFAMMLAFADNPGARVGAGILLGVFFVMTKLESLKAGDFLVTRVRVEGPDRRRRFQRAALAGSLVSVFALAGAGLATGRLQPALDHDLEVESDDAWSVSRKVSEWDFFRDDPSARARWTHRDGLQMTMFAYPLNPMDDREAFESRFRQEMTQDGWRLVSQEPIRGGTLAGDLQLWSGPDGKGGEVVALHSFVYDEAGKDIHQCALAVTPELAEYAGRLVGDFLAHARFRDPIPPER